MSSDSRFAVFAFLFAAATIFYHAEQFPWLELTPGAIPLVAAFAVALKPTWVAGFAVLVSTQIVHALLGLPLINTNRTVQLIVGATILGALLLEMARDRFRLPSGGRWLRAFEGPVRLEVGLVYFFAFWHKINADYLDRATSCGAALYRHLAHWPWFSFLPVETWTEWAAIAGALAMEAVLPVLLFVPRFRTAGFVAGVAFHAVLGAARFFAFSATMTALLFLFAPQRLTDWLVPKATAAFTPPLRLIVAGTLIAVSLAGPFHLRPMFYWVWLTWTAGLLAVLAAGLRGEPSAKPLPPLFPSPHPVLLCLPVLALLNGASPYLGLKTEYSFAMYSNLRTEQGATNHLILPRKLALADYQDELARVIDSSEPEIARLAADARPIPIIWLRRLISEQEARGARGISITLERNGAVRRIENAETHTELGRPPSFLERKLLRFRDILPRNGNVCAH